MKKIMTITGGFVLVLVLSAALAPLLAPVLPFKFHRILSRCVMVGTFGLLFWVVKREKIDLRTFFSAMRLGWSADSVRLCGAGFVLSAAAVMTIIVVQIMVGARHVAMTVTGVEWIVVAGEGIGAGLLIGVLEEVFFRGVLFRQLAKRWSPIGSLVVVNAVYAAVHFFKRGAVCVGDTPTMVDSFRLIGGYFSSFADFGQMAPAFVGLFVFGCVLTIAYMRGMSLWLPIGIHGGAVCIIKTHAEWSRFDAGHSPLVFGTAGLYDGLLGWGLLVVLGLSCVVVFRKEAKRYVELFR